MEEVDILLLGRRSVQGVFALISRQFVLQIISTATALIIFTILTPKDIGLYTAVVAMQRIISFFSDFGFGAALIQKKDSLLKQDITTAFTIQFLVTSILFLFILLLSPFVTTFFRLSPNATTLLLVLVFTLVLSSFKMIPSILLERTINFQKLIIPQIIEQFLYNLLLIFLVTRGFGINSYTWAIFISSIVSIPFYYMIQPWPIQFGIAVHSLHHLKFGIQFQAKNILATIKDDFLTIFLIKFISFTELGYIGFAQRVSFLIFRYVVDSVTKVTFSTYSRLQDNKEILKKAVEKSLFFVSLTIFPILFGLILTVPYIIQYFPGWQTKWQPAVLSVIFFSLNAAVSSVSNILVNILDATGRVKTTLRLMVMWTILTWILTPIFLWKFGYNGVAIASFIVTLSIGVTIYLVKKVVEFDFLKSVKVPILCTAIMCTFTWIGTQIFVKDVLSLIVIIILSGAIYMLSVSLLVGKEIYNTAQILVRKK